MADNQNYTIKETTEFLNFLFDGTDAYIQSKGDGKINIADVPNFLKMAMAAPKAIAGVVDIPKEFADMSEAEKAELFKVIRDRFDIEDDVLEAHIENIIYSVFELWKNIGAIYNLKKAA